MSVSEQVAYLRGLMDGLNLDEDDNTTKTLILVREDSQMNENVIVDGDNIESVKDGEFKYWIDKENDKKPETVKLADSLSMIYNGVGMDVDLSILTSSLAN